MIRTLHRTKGAPALGATSPGQSGPFGPYGSNEPDESTPVHQIFCDGCNGTAATYNEIKHDPWCSVS